MILRTKLAAGLAIAGLSVSLVAAEGDDTVGTARFEDLTVEVVGGEIEVTGTAVFGGETIVVGDDAVGDVTAPVGVDLSTLTITQADDQFTFEMGLADALPELGSLPVGTMFRWPLVEDGGNTIELAAWPTNAAQAALSGTSVQWVFTLFTLSPDGFGESPLDGEFTGSSLVWHVPVAATGLRPGTDYVAFDKPRSAGGYSGALAGGNRFDEVNTDVFTVGGGAVVVLYKGSKYIDEALARVRRGTFSASFDGLEPGTYTVDVWSGYGDASIVETFTVEV